MQRVKFYERNRCVFAEIFLHLNLNVTYQVNDR